MSVRKGRGALLAALLPILTLAFAGTGSAAQRGVATASGGTMAQRPESRTIESDDVVLREARTAVQASKSCATLTALALRYMELGLGEPAMTYFSQAVKLDVKCAAAHDGLARLWRNAGALGLAGASAHRATHFAPRSAAFWNTYGTIQQALGQNEGAAAAYRRSVELDSSAAYAHSNLCYLAVLAANTEAALASCEAALAIDPTFAPALNNLALLHAASGDRGRAFELFTAARGVAAAHYNMGVVDLAERNYAAAVEEFEAAYREDPAFDEAHAAARRARKLLQQKSEKTRADDRRR